MTASLTGPHLRPIRPERARAYIAWLRDRLGKVCSKSHNRYRAFLRQSPILNSMDIQVVGPSFFGTHRTFLRDDERRDIMAWHSVQLEPGKWWRLHTFFNTTAHATFVGPAGVQIKVRYGVGWLGKDGQKQTLDGRTTKQLSIGKSSVFRARMQAKSRESVVLTYNLFLTGP